MVLLRLVVWGLHQVISCLTPKFLLSILYVIVAVSPHSKALVYLLAARCQLARVIQYHLHLYTMVNATSLTFLNAMDHIWGLSHSQRIIKLYRMFGASAPSELHRIVSSSTGNWYGVRFILSALRIRSMIKGYVVALTDDISKSCWFRLRLYKTDCAPDAVTP